MMLQIYLFGAGVMILLHLLFGHLSKMATIKRHGRVIARVPFALIAIALALTWPVSLPIQIYQNRED